MEINIAVVPVAGLGTRLLPATKSQPKEMLPVGRKPVVQYVVEELTRMGMRRLLFITGPGKTSIENHFDLNGELIQVLRETGKEELLAELEFERAPVQYFYTRQRQLLGLGHAISCAQPFVGDQPFVVALGDSIIGMQAQSDIVQRMTRCFVDIFEIADLIEKPSVEEAPSNLAIAARYVLAPAIFEAIRHTRPGKGGEVQVTDAIRILIQGGGKVYGVCLRDDERRYDIGNFQAYFRAFVEFALADDKEGAVLRQHLEALLNDHHS
jgi:UTP--glucose-1-phosphate uridylyltransferase